MTRELAIDICKAAGTGSDAVAQDNLALEQAAAGDLTARVVPRAGFGRRTKLGVSDGPREYVVRRKSSDAMQRPRRPPGGGSCP